MVFTIQPCDWIEHDERGKYVVDVYGRTEETATMVRIEGFKPYMYVLPSNNTVQAFKTELTKEKVNATSVIVIETKKYDAFEGFNHFKPVTVWKIEYQSLRDWRTGGKICKAMFPRVYESNIPPFLRLFHDRNIGPASPFVVLPASKIEGGWTARFQDIVGDPSKNISLKVAAYDIECTSKSGQFPIAKKEWSYVIERFAADLAKDDESSLTEILVRRLQLEGMVVPPIWRDKTLIPFLSKDSVQTMIEKENWTTFTAQFEALMGSLPIGDPIIQIGVSVRLSTNMLITTKRRVFVWGTVSGSSDFVSCESEGDLIEAFVEFLHEENIDVLCGYNTYGFDDKYICDRAEVNGMKSLKFGRTDIYGGLLEHKVFELASGKYNVNYLKMPGRLSIDLLLNMRREHSLDSYTLDNVASTFLRDKVVKVEGSTIFTKTTRGLFAGNYVKFDVVGNTINTYQEGRKFLVKSVSPKSFEIDEKDLFKDLSPDDRAHLEWSFTKDDIHPADIFRLHEGTAEDRGTVAKYCVQDCDLVLTLMAKLDTLVNARGMADVCFVPFQYLFLRGQGIKIFSRVAYEASKRDQIIAVQESYDGDTSYEGAIVISPKIGMYLETPVAVLDFNSLYPSSMIGENLSPDTLICMKTYNADGRLISLEGMKDITVPYNEVSYDIKDGDTVTGKCVCIYVQPTEGNELSTGLIPRSLEIMLKMRKEARKKMEDPEMDDAQKSVYNGLQLAYKVVANSIYGQMGSRTSPIRKICVAACTTAVGRRQLLFAKSTVETDFGAQVVYGDSVAKYTPVMVRIHGNINILRIDHLDAYGKGWMQYGDKELCELDGVESWTESGWTRVKNIIRHRLVDGKKIVRVLTHSGVVDVTDDHSLVRNDGTAVSSNELVVGDKLLHNAYPAITTEAFEITVEESRIAGFFFGDGSCGCYECPSGDKASWALNNADMKLLEFYKEVCEKAYPSLTWKILPTLESSGVYKLVPSGNVKPFIVAYRASMYTSEKEKRIPLSVLNGSEDIRKAFWDGLYDADGDKNGINVRVDQKSQLSASHIMYLGASLGYKVSVTDRCSKEHIYRVTCTKSYQRKDPDAIKRIRDIPIYTGFVYDLTTDNHHFQAGVGKMIVHNTDSIFVKFPKASLEESIKLGQESAKLITSRCRHKAFVIGYEKTFYPFILFCRKRYVGMKYEEDPTKCYRASMGIVLKRRDNAPIVKDVFGGALDILLQEKNVKIAADYVKSMLIRVVKGDFPIEKFAITKQLRDDYKDPTRIAHRVLADRMTARDPGNAPNVGERLKFVYIQTHDKKLQGDKIEHIDYVKEKKLAIDTVHYVTNQIQNPVAQLFALCIHEMDGYKEPSPSYAKLYEQYYEKLGDEEEATLKVLGHKEKHLEKLLFMDAPYIGNVVRASKRGPLDAFFKRV
jgi:DNA polymerase elongation subunit (family B)